MISALYLILSFLAGIGLGIFYFGTLWLTLQYLPKIRRPALLTLGGFFARMAITLLGFYLVMGGRWERLLIALCGFILVRIFLIHRLRGNGKRSKAKRGIHGSDKLERDQS